MINTTLNDSVCTGDYPLNLEAWKPDAVELNEARNIVINEITNYLDSGDCPEPEQVQELFRTRSELITEHDMKKLREIIQAYYINTFYCPILVDSGPELRQALGGDKALPEIMGVLWKPMAQALGLTILRKHKCRNRRKVK